METNKIKTKAVPADSPNPEKHHHKSDDEKVALFASHLAEVYTPTPTPPTQKWEACSPTTQNASPKLDQSPHQT
jgi:hypothetical protein